MTTFDTRAQLALPAPRSRSFTISPTHVAGHYAAVGRWNLDEYDSHDVCRIRWLRMQQSAVRSGYVDVPYTAMCCHHDVVMAGRGAGVRTGANGSDTWNYRAYALCFPLGPYDNFGTLMRDGDPRAVNMLRAWWSMIDVLSEHAGRELAPTLHSAIRRTACPGSIGPWLTDRTIIEGASPPEEDPMAWLERWPTYFRALAQRLRDRGWITEDTDPNERLGDLTVGEYLALQDRIHGKDRP